MKKMKDNLPIFLMHTMGKMQRAPDFFPSLDVRELYKLVKPAVWSVALLNPSLLGLTGGSGQGDDGGDSSDSGRSISGVGWYSILDAAW